MALPQIVATGNITSDPDLRFTGSGIAQLKFRIACNERKKDADGKWVDGRSTFLSVICWRQTAEQAAEQLSKGDEVTIVGKLSVEPYTDKDGNERLGVEIIADSVARTFGRIKTSTATRTAAPSFDETPF